MEILLIYNFSNDKYMVLTNKYRKTEKHCAEVYPRFDLRAVKNAIAVIITNQYMLEYACTKTKRSPSQMTTSAYNY